MCVVKMTILLPTDIFEGKLNSEFGLNIPTFVPISNLARARSRPCLRPEIDSHAPVR